MTKENLRDLCRVIDAASTTSGERLAVLSEESPVLLVFLRHAGCTFCREALSDIARQRSAIERTGARIILVHMRDSQSIEKLAGRYGLQGVKRICDSSQALYRAFGLKRGRLMQLLGPKVLWRGIHAGLLEGHGIGRPTADSFQMPGVFLIHQSTIVGRVRHRTAADRPDYARLCAELKSAAAR